MIGHMAIAIALFGRSVSPTFLFINVLNLQLSPHCPKLDENQCGKVKKKRFLATGHVIMPSCGCKARETNRNPTSLLNSLNRSTRFVENISL